MATIVSSTSCIIIELELTVNLGYHTWRKLGDVISSIFALGYHEDIDAKPDTPPFLIQLRKTAFARIYSADKNVAIFLGRPPRMTKRFCYFQIPSDYAGLKQDVGYWSPDTPASYNAETRWSALCASLKEEILELARDKNHQASMERIRYAVYDWYEFSIATRLIRAVLYRWLKKPNGRRSHLTFSWKDPSSNMTGTRRLKEISCLVCGSIIFMSYSCFGCFYSTHLLSQIPPLYPSPVKCWLWLLRPYWSEIR